MMPVFTFTLIEIFDDLDRVFVDFGCFLGGPVAMLGQSMSIIKDMRDIKGSLL